MAKNRTKKKPVIGQRQGTDLVLLAGLPRWSLSWLLKVLDGDRSKKQFEFAGVPSIKGDFKDLYVESTLTEFQKILTARITKNSSAPVPTPRRILMLYVPSKDIDVLIYKFGIACFMEPLAPTSSLPSLSNNISWRHDENIARQVVSDALERAVDATNALKIEITDKSRSPFSLPARNFYYPDSETLIYESYLALVRQAISIEALSESLTARRFTRDHLPDRALKGSQYADRFYQDARGRIFPPDRYHPPVRYADSSDTNIAGRLDIEWRSNALTVLHQRYRFGVIVRDGNLHYDVQYEIPKKLYQEPMYCSTVGNVKVTGSHANVGVNDVIWVPDGEKEPVSGGQKN